MKAVADEIKSSLSTEEEPFEGEVSIKDIEKRILDKMEKNKGKKVKYLFDGYTHPKGEQFSKFIEQFDSPDVVI